MTLAHAQTAVKYPEIIYSYSRAEAIADGVLIDIDFTPEGETMPLAKQAGIKYPVAMTAAAWAETIGRGGTWEDDPENPDEEILTLPAGQDVIGRTWDIFTMLKHGAQRASGPEIRLEVRVWDGKRIRVARLKAVCGPGDDLEPVITIMMPNED